MKADFWPHHGKEITGIFDCFEKKGCVTIAISSLDRKPVEKFARKTQIFERNNIALAHLKSRNRSRFRVHG
ncbi:MAG: hypothetical protein HZA01_11570 [Nitrospinae bacterium]|nr:hypothetical protein [Nitrospinota bacterium]